MNSDLHGQGNNWCDFRDGASVPTAFTSSQVPRLSFVEPPTSRCTVKQAQTVVLLARAEGRRERKLLDRTERLAAAAGSYSVG